jgi:hypothetical protein
MEPITLLMRNPDRLTAIILGGFGAYIAFEGYRLELGVLQKPKPGFLIFWVGVILSGLSLLLWIQTFFSAEAGKTYLWKGVKWQRGFILILLLLVYIGVFQWLGFLLSTFGLLLFLFKSLDSQKWSFAFLLSLVTTVLGFFIFGYFLEIQFPAGVLKGILR